MLVLRFFLKSILYLYYIEVFTQHRLGLYLQTSIAYMYIMFLKPSKRKIVDETVFRLLIIIRDPLRNANVSQKYHIF